MSYCTRCGAQLAEGALYCTSCGAIAADLSVSQPDLSPSHFNATVTTTTQPSPEPGFAVPPQPSQEERPPSSGRRRLVIVVIAVLVVLLAGTAVESGILSPVGGGPPAINSPSDPLTGSQLYAAYTSNLTQATASYTNKTLYIQDNLNYGVSVNLAGQYYSYVASGNVVLFWNGQPQLSQLYPGAVFVAKCSVEGLQATRGVGTLLYLDGCDLVSVQSQSTSTSFSVSAANE